MHIKGQITFCKKRGPPVSSLLWELRMKRGGPITSKCVAPQLVNSHQVLSSHNHHHIGLIWESWKREKKVPQATRERWDKKCTFSRWRVPYLHHPLWLLLWLLNCPMASPLPSTFTFDLYLLTHFTLSLYCSLNVIAIAHWLWHLLWHLLSLLQLWLLMKFNSLPWFFLFPSSHLPLENSMPPRIHIHFSPAT